MTAVSVATLRANAEQIRLETILRANTAQRVGQMLRDIIDSGTAGGFTSIEATGSDEQAAIQAALTAGNQTVFLQPGTHLISDRVTIGSNTTIDGAPGAILKLADGANEFCLTIAAGATNVKIRNIEIDGNKANNPSGSSGIQNEDATASRVLVQNVYVHDCNGAGMRLSGSVVKVDGCTSVDNGIEGITGDSISYFGFYNNYAARNGTHNIGLIGTGTYGVIDGNTAELSGALADNLTGYGVTNQFICWTNNVSRAGGNNGVHVGGSHITFSNNTIEDATDYGLIARNSDASDMPGFECTGNVITNSGASGANSGVWLGNLAGFIFSNNIIKGSYAHGILIQEACEDGVVSGNLAISNGSGAGSGNGIRIVGSCARITVSGNTSKSNVSEGIQVSDSTGILLQGNTSTVNSIPLAIDGASSVYVIGNNFIGNTSDAPSVVAGTVAYWADSPNGGSLNLASSSGITLPVFTDYIRVTGGSNINAITASWAQRMVTLRFTSTPQLTTQAGLIIGSGIFTGISNATLSLISDGSTWFETSRMKP